MRSPISPALYDQFARGWRGYALIALIALTSALLGAGRMPAMDVDEARTAQAARQMVEGGDLLIPRVQDQRLPLPPGAPWLQAFTASAMQPLTPQRNSIWPYRLPSAFGLVLAAVAALWAGRALLKPRAAFMGAGLFAAGLLTGVQGMLATPEALALGFTTLALSALAQLRRDDVGTPKRFALVFWAALASAVLMKGLMPVLAVALTLGALAIWEKRTAWLAPLSWGPGPLLALAIIAPWFALAVIETQGAIVSDFARAISSRFSDDFALPGTHLLLLAFLIFPAAYAMPAATRLAIEGARAPRDDEAQAPVRFLIAASVPFFALMELLPVKQAHDVLLAYPAMALLSGAGLEAMRGRPWRSTHPAGIVLFGVAGAVIVTMTGLGATFMPGDLDTDLRRAVSAGLVGFGVLGLSLAALLALHRPAARAAVLIACALVLSFTLRERVLPETRELHVSSEARAALTRARLLPRDNRSLWVVGYHETSLVFATRSDLRFTDAATVGAEAQHGQALIVEGRALREVEDALAERGLRFEVLEPPVRGLALGRGERVALSVGRVVSDAAADAPPQNP